MDVCPICQNPKGLINGMDSKLQIEYPSDKLEAFAAGELSLTQLNQHALFYYTRTRLCDNQGNANTMVEKDGKEVLLNPPCSNYYGIRGGTIENPDVVVETIKIRDE